MHLHINREPFPAAKKMIIQIRLQQLVLVEMQRLESGLFVCRVARNRPSVLLLRFVFRLLFPSFNIESRRPH
jgi:hypothetical protein